MENEQNEVIRLLKKGGELTRDLIVGATTFRIISGSKVKIFPLVLLEDMKKRDILEIKKVLSMHSVYRLVPEKKQSEANA